VEISLTEAVRNAGFAGSLSEEEKAAGLAAHPALQHGFDCFGDYVIDAMTLVRFDDVRWENVDDVAERTKEDAAFEEEVVELGAEAGKIARIVHAKFEGADGTDLPDVPDLVEIAKLREAFGVNPGDGANAIENGFVIENLQIGIGRGAGQRVPRVGMTVIEGVHPIFTSKSGFHAVGA
jgi:hypothetical protein